MRGRRLAVGAGLAAGLAACGDGVGGAGGAADTGDGCAPPEGAFEADPWGGDARVDLGGTGWFRLDRSCGRDWLVDPEGHPVYALGVNGWAPRGSTGLETGRDRYAEAVAALYDSETDWADEAARRARSWGLTTAGGWSDAGLASGRLPYAPVLGLAGDDWLTGEVADWWSPEWEEAVAAEVAEQVAPRSEDRWLQMWFLDNEVRWGPDWRGIETLLQVYLAMGAEAPGKAAAVDYLLGELGSVAAVSALAGVEAETRDDLLAATEGWDGLDRGASEEADALTAGFLELAAERFYEVAVGAVRAADPHHLVAGVRDVAVTAPVEAHLAAARHCDLLSINDYTFADGVAEAALALTGAPDPAGGFAELRAALEEADLARPVVVTEFSFRADDSGLPNSWPPVYPTLETQEERAEATRAYVREHFEAPWIVGQHWFRWVDEPADGRVPDGEDSNFGLVTEADEPYEQLTAALAELGEEARALLRVPR